MCIRDSPLPELPVRVRGPREPGVPVAGVPGALLARPPGLVEGPSAARHKELDSLGASRALDDS
eukprot:6728563-Pyramimonas_sp.AAC.1